MNKLIRCRRSIVALAGIGACLAINLNTGADTSGAIAMIVAALAGANAAQASMEAKHGAAE